MTGLWHQNNTLNYISNTVNLWNTKNKKMSLNGQPNMIIIYTYLLLNKKQVICAV